MSLNVNSYRLEHTNLWLKCQTWKFITILNIYERDLLPNILECTSMKLWNRMNILNFTIPKISASIGINKCLKYIVLLDTLKLMYNAIVHPHFDYVDTVYDSTSEFNKWLQTRTAKLITVSGPWNSRSPIFKALGWLSLQHRRDFHIHILVFKCRRNLAP